MISKELLSEVLNKDIKYFEMDINKINYNINGSIKKGNIAYFLRGEWNYINIYELAHKVKEYVFKYDYELESYKDRFDNKWKCNAIQYVITDSIETLFVANTEPEAIFKAGEWVLKEIKK